MSIEIYDLPAMSLIVEPVGKSEFKVTVACLKRPMTGIEMDSLSRTLSSCHMLAAEIKRLGAEYTQLQTLALNKNIKIKELEARIALLEAALGLPDGCDVFQLERAMKDGAVDEYGYHWRFSEQLNTLSCFCLERDFGIQNMWVDHSGFCYGVGRLYCIKEANK